MTRVLNAFVRLNFADEAGPITTSGPTVDTSGGKSTTTTNQGGVGGKYVQVRGMSAGIKLARVCVVDW